MNSEKRFYSLYHKRKAFKIKIKLMKPSDILYETASRMCSSGINGDTVYYNDCYYLSINRKELKEIAHYIKDEWEMDLSYQLGRVNEIKI